MDKSDLGKFVEANLKRGRKIEEIKQELLSRGFFDYDINEAISKLNLEKPVEETSKPPKTESIEGWDKEIKPNENPQPESTDESKTI